jgi:AcrR family transcriptional regulator
MARKEPPKSRRKTPDASAQAIIDAALALAREEAWQTVSLSDIADKAGISLAQVYAAFPSKAAIVGGFMKRIDQ